jgi:hypothetical protein
VKVRIFFDSPLMSIDWPVPQSWVSNTDHDILLGASKMRYFHIENSFYINNNVIKMELIKSE